MHSRCLPFEKGWGLHVWVVGSCLYTIGAWVLEGGLGCLYTFVACVWGGRGGGPVPGGVGRCLFTLGASIWGSLGPPFEGEGVGSWLYTSASHVLGGVGGVGPVSEGAGCELLVHLCQGGGEWGGEGGWRGAGPGLGPVSGWSPVLGRGWWGRSCLWAVGGLHLGVVGACFCWQFGACL